VLYEIDEQPAVEIATMLDLPLNTVYKTVTVSRLWAAAVGRW